MGTRRLGMLSPCRTWSIRNCSPFFTRLARRSFHFTSETETRIALAIETSCDDTAVAVVRYHLSKQNDATHLVHPPARYRLEILFHRKVTANNNAYAGIHPLVALHSHRSNLAPLIKEALHDRIVAEHLHGSLTPDLVAVTRGPGMRSNLAVGIDTAKGLATAWKVPLIGVHHMQAHALTPRLVTAIDSIDGSPSTPAFPFISVLASGGHTMLMDSINLTQHRTLAETQDIALGDFLDKAARAILPSSLLKAPFGKALEQFAFHMTVHDLADNHAYQTGTARTEVNNPEFIQVADCDYGYIPPARRQDELTRRSTKWDWSLAPPLAESKGGEKSSRRMVYSFSGLLSSIERIMKATLTVDPHEKGHMSLAERQDLAREAQRVAFEHLASRILLHISSQSDGWAGNTVVISGGVASNKFLRHVLREMLDARGYSDVMLSFPPIDLCTDNALMIAWAGIEMYEAGYRSDLAIGPIRKWSMDSEAPDGGILGIGGWIRKDVEE